MQFEFGPGKSERNLPKRGIDVKAAQALWTIPGCSGREGFVSSEAASFVSCA